MEWPRVRLDEIAKIVMGQSPPGETYNNEGDGLPFFQGKADFGDRYPTTRKWCSVPARIAEPEDILLSVRAPVGPTNLARENCCIGRGLAAIRANPAIASQGYLSWFLTYQEPFLSQQGQGSTFAAIKRNEVGGIKVPLPPLSEQRRIVEILDQADRLRRLRVKADAKAERILPALFIKMFGDPGTNPMGWDEKPFRDILMESPRNGLSFSSRGSFHSKVLTLSAITGARFDETAVKQSHFANKPCENKTVDCQDFLVCRGNGNLENVGRARFSPRTMGDTVFPDTIIAVRVDPQHVHRAYLETLWETKWMRLQIESRSTTTSGIHKINQATLGDLLVRLPPLPLQIRFGGLSKRLHLIGKSPSTDILNRVFDSLSHRAFRGNPTDERKSLLSKIFRHHPEFPAVPWGKGLSEAVFQDPVCPFSHYKF